MYFFAGSALAGLEHCNMDLAAGDLEYEIERQLPSRFDVRCYMQDTKCSLASCFVHNTINDDGLPDAEFFCQLMKNRWNCTTAEPD